LRSIRNGQVVRHDEMKKARRSRLYGGDFYDALADNSARVLLDLISAAFCRIRKIARDDLIASGTADTFEAAKTAALFEARAQSSE
jgi:hypothetical protein